MVLVKSVVNSLQRGLLQFDSICRNYYLQLFGLGLKYIIINLLNIFLINWLEP